MIDRSSATLALNSGVRYLSLLENSEHPLGYEAGDDNLYRYVGNNPVNKIDPSGQEESACHELTALFDSVDLSLRVPSRRVLLEDSRRYKFQGEIFEENERLPSERGTFSIRMRGTSIKTSNSVVGPLGTISFWPDRATSESYKEIRLIQAAKFTQRKTEFPRKWIVGPEIKKITTRDNWHIDVFETGLAKGNTSFYYREHFPHIDYSSDHCPNDLGGLPASLFDWPGWHGSQNWTHEFETVAVGITDRYVVQLGSIKWGYDVKDKVLSFHEVKVLDEPTASFSAALNLFLKTYSRKERIRQAPPTKFPDSPFFENIFNELEGKRNS